IYFAAQGKKVAVELIQTRCETGAGIAKELGFSEAVANGIFSVDEHFNGKGGPAGLNGEAIPIYSRIALVAQVADVFQMMGGKFAALKEVRERQDTWFDPQVVKAFEEVAEDAAFWETLNKDDILQTVIGLEPASKVIKLTEDLLDTIATAFSKIIDSKSPFTFGHSTRVAEFAVAIAKLDGMEPDRMRWLNRAALLHDIGKLGVSNAILDKPGSLTKEEYELVKQHPRHTKDILSKISIFDELAVIAGAHHERLDGLGYPNGLKADDIAMETRILTVADIYDALTAERPYREAMRNHKAFEILNGMRNGAIEGKYVDLLRKNVE
ncbi:MAG: HD domain-containing protein, partial [Candidatus Omnitrophica bacterium]|nr:HD domain-containing protein [Candidatus Omnitrophota bacterium]